MRACSIAAGLLVAATLATSADNPGTGPGRPTLVKRMIGPNAVAAAAMGAGVNQGNNSPSEWGQGAAGFGKRFASALGKHVVKSAIQSPVAYIRHEEVGYRPSNKHGFGPRLRYALVSTVITRKTTTGKTTISTSEISGAFGSGLISRLWQPASLHTVSSGFLSGGITLGVDAGGHVLREFWPEIRHPRSHSHVEASADSNDPINDHQHQ